MRVLLVSPIDPIIPSDLKFLMGGENTYTRNLIENPPRGVEYVYYLNAIRDGEVRYGSLQKFLKRLVKFRILPLAAGTIDIEILGDFDLVYCHAYTLRLSNKKVRSLPVILGDSIPAYWSLSNYFGQSEMRIKTQYLIRRLTHQFLDVYDQDLFWGKFYKLVVMSQFAKREHVKLGADPKRIEVVYPGLPDRGERKRGKKGQINILFAGVWFERKGGRILLEAYKKVRKRFSENVSLTMLGPLPNDLRSLNVKDQGIVQHDFVPYERLVGEFYLKADVLVHVPPEAEGYGLVVQEAMSFGLPVVVSKIGALKEMVSDGDNGLLVNPGNVEDLEKALIRLCEDSELRIRIGKNARHCFLTKFSLPIFQKNLLRIYKGAMRTIKQ
jgi:glycosyltransferase involved in cell wall biosynthesis